MSNAKPVIRILDGEITLYKHRGGLETNWYVRFRDPSGTNRYVKQSLKTANEDLAREAAMQLYNDARARFSIGAPSGRVSWDYIFKKFIDEMSGSNIKWARKINKRYWNQWFSKNIDDFFKLSDADLLQYTRYRIDYWKNHEVDGSIKYRKKLMHVKKTPSTETLLKESRILNYFLRRAFEHRLTAVKVRCPGARKLRDEVKKKELPKHLRRARFDDLQMAKFITHLRTAKERNQAGNFPKGRGWGNPRHRFLAARNYFYIITISNSGIRPQAMKLLQFRDWREPLVDPDGTSFTRIHIPADKCKTGNDRTIVTRDFLDSHKRYLEYKSEWELYFNRSAKPDDYLFVPAMGTSELASGAKLEPCDMTYPVRRALKECGLWETTLDGIAHRRSAYSARAYFITKSLQRGCPLDVLSKHCATSPEMIQKYYDHSAAVDFRGWITQHHEKYTFTKDIQKI